MKALRIDIYFDLICPWCLIGKHNLDLALLQLAQSHPELAIEKRWHSVELLPGLPREGVPFLEFYINRLGSLIAVRERQEQVLTAANRAGAPIKYSEISIMPNTAMAHRLIGYVNNKYGPEKGETLIDALLAAYFQQDRNIGDWNVLIEIARDCDVQTDAFSEQATATDATPESGPLPPASGVPCYVFNDRVVLSGAHPPYALQSEIRKALGMAREIVETAPQ